MRSPTTDTAGDFIIDQVDGSVSKPTIKTEWFSDTQSTWKEIDPGDIESRNINLETRNDRYQVQSFMPPSKDMSLLVNNYQQQYNVEGTDLAKRDIFKKNRLIRCWTGYIFPTATDSSLSDDFITSTKFVNTEKTGAKVCTVAAGYSGTIATAAQLGGSTYGATGYGSATYGGLGYYTKTYTLPLSETVKPKSITLFSNSNDAKARYRSSALSNFSDASWSTFQTLATGSNTINLNSAQNDNYVQYLVTFVGNTYGVDCISTSSLTYGSFDELFKQGVFIIDEPVFNNKVSIKGRDYLRKGLETEISMPDQTSAEPVTTVISKALDRASIPYDTATWDLVTTAVSVDATLSEELQDISAYKVINKLMYAVNAGDDDMVFKFDDDGNAQIKRIPTSTEADFLAHFHFNIEEIQKDLDSSKQLQRITALNKNIIVNEESLLKSATGGATSSLTITYSDALYVRYEDNNNRILSEQDRTNGSLTLSLSTAGAYDIDVYGNTPKNAITNEKWAERGNSGNIINNDGYTHKTLNEYFNGTLAKAYCDYTINKFQDPSKRVRYLQVPNPLIELDDNGLVFARETSDDTIYGVTAISEQWSNPGLKADYTLIDKGVTLTNYVWDRNGYNDGTNDFKYDTGLIYDFDLGFNATSDSFDYDVYKPVRFTLIDTTLVFHTKAGSDAEWTSPVVGTSATKVGTPTYSTGKFGDGTDGVASAMWRKNPIDYFANNDRGSIGFWYVPGSGFTGLNNWLVYWRPGSGGDPEIQIRFLGTSFNVAFSRTGVTDYFNSSVTASTYFTVGVPAHIGFSWDISGIGAGSNKFEVYVDNSLIMSSSSSFVSANWAVSDSISGFLNNGVIATNYLRGVMDNIKIYDVARQDWSDKDTE